MPSPLPPPPLPPGGRFCFVVTIRITISGDLAAFDLSWFAAWLRVLAAALSPPSLEAAQGSVVLTASFLIDDDAVAADAAATADADDPSEAVAIAMASRLNGVDFYTDAIAGELGRTVEHVDPAVVSIVVVGAPPPASPPVPPPALPPPTTPPPPLVCGASAAAVCAGPSELCYYDAACADASHADHAGGLGCNAGGLGQNCRFCGFGEFGDCPVIDWGEAEALSTSLDSAPLVSGVAIAGGAALMVALSYVACVRRRRRKEEAKQRELEKIARAPSQATTTTHAMSGGDVEDGDGDGGAVAPSTDLLHFCASVGGACTARAASKAELERMSTVPAALPRPGTAKNLCPTPTALGMGAMSDRAAAAMAGASATSALEGMLRGANGELLDANAALQAQVARLAAIRDEGEASDLSSLSRHTKLRGSLSDDAAFGGSSNRAGGAAAVPLTPEEVKAMRERTKLRRKMSLKAADSERSLCGQKEGPGKFTLRRGPIIPAGAEHPAGAELPQSTTSPQRVVAAAPPSSSPPPGGVAAARRVVMAAPVGRGPAGCGTVRV